jgi:hypothetical protein
MSPFGLPRLPRIGESPISAAGGFVKSTISDIKKLAEDIDEGLGTIDQELTSITREKIPEQTESQEPQQENFVSDDSTYRFQLDLLIDNATDLETVHLPNKGRINGASCDCISKHARILRAHAKETIPIASRQGKDTIFFSELAKFADHLMQIGTKEAVESGQYDDEFLEKAGVMSRYRKKLEDLLGHTHVSYSQQCATCPSTLDLKAFIKKKETVVGKKNTESIEESTVNIEA